MFMGKRLTKLGKGIFTGIYVTLLLLVYLMITAFTGLSADECKEVKIEKLVVVTSGDTLWDIARENNPKQKNVRKWLDEIVAYNKLESTNLRPGDAIIIPA